MIRGDRPNDRRGNMSYRDYLKSDDWKQKRATKRSKNNNCAICNSTEDILDTHHLNYRNLFDVKQSDLRVLCRRCHFLAHDLMKQGKLVFSNDNHHSKFTLTKTAVKKELGLTGKNMFVDNGQDSLFSPEGK